MLVQVIEVREAKEKLSTFWDSWAQGDPQEGVGMQPDTRKLQLWSHGTGN